MTPSERLATIKVAFAPDCPEQDLPTIADLQNALSITVWLSPDFRIYKEPCEQGCKVRLVWRGYGACSEGQGIANNEADALVMAVCDWAKREMEVTA